MKTREQMAFKLCPLNINYLVFSNGTVMNIKTQKFIKIHKRPTGYRYVSIGGRHTINICRLLLLTFRPHPNSDNLQAAHLDGSKDNDTLDNLKWCTPKENSDHQYLHGTRGFGEKSNRSKLGANDVLEIRNLFELKGIPVAELASKYKICKSNVRHILRRDTWSHI